MATLMYGSGLRLLETCRLRVRDIDFDRQIITVRAGKGDKDRTTLLPALSIPALQHSITVAKHQLDDRLQHGVVPVTLPHALDRKYPNAGVSLAWQWLFPASRPCFDDTRQVVLASCHPCGSPCAACGGISPGRLSNLNPSAYATKPMDATPDWSQAPLNWCRHLSRPPKLHDAQTQGPRAR